MPLFLNLRTMPGRHWPPKEDRESKDGLRATLPGPALLTPRQVPRGLCPPTDRDTESALPQGIRILDSSLVPAPPPPLGQATPIREAWSDIPAMLRPLQRSVPRVASGSRTPGPSDSPSTPTAPQDQAGHCASSGRLPILPNAHDALLATHTFLLTALQQSSELVQQEDSALGSDSTLPKGRVRRINQESGTRLVLQSTSA